jgi:hypothetical protein
LHGLPGIGDHGAQVTVGLPAEVGLDAPGRREQDRGIARTARSVTWM